MSRFTTDTAVESLGDGRYGARIDRGWWIERGPNGGYLAAIVLRAMLAELDDPERRPRSLTLHYLRPPVEGLCEIVVVVERAGRGMTTLSARLQQDGLDCITALVALGVDRAGVGFDDQRAPQVPPPEDVPPPPDREIRVPIHERYEVRPTFGAALFSAATEALTGGWIRTADHDPVDEILVAALTDAWIPAVFSRLESPVGPPSTSRSTSVRPPRLPAPGPSSASARVLWRRGTSRRTVRCGPPTVGCSRRAASSRWCWPRVESAREGAGQHGPRGRRRLDRQDRLLGRGVRSESDWPGQGVQHELVGVLVVACGRAGREPAREPVAVAGLERAFRQGVGGEPLHGRIDAGDHPVHEPVGVEVAHDQRQLRCLGRRRPLQLRRDARPGAGVGLGDRVPVDKGHAAEREHLDGGRLGRSGHRLVRSNGGQGPPIAGRAGHRRHRQGNGGQERHDATEHPDSVDHGGGLLCHLGRLAAYPSGTQMDAKPRNLRSMLAEAKDLSELMVDLAYAALYFGDPDMAEEVGELEDRMSDLVHEMRAVSVLAARHPKEAEAMASVLQVVSAIERIGNAAVDIARIVTHRLGIPRELVADLSNAEEVSHRVRIREGSHLARRPLAALELPVQTGMRVVAIRREREWITDVDGEVICLPGDVIFLRGSPAGIPRLRELAAAPYWEPAVPPEDGTLSDLDRAVDVLVEMKNISEVAVGLAYSALVLRDQGLAAEVRHLEDRLDEMKDRLELWVLRASNDRIDPAPLRGLLHLSQAAEDLGDAAQQMVWLIEEKEELHPILSIALGDSDEVVVRVPVAAGSAAAGSTLSALQLDIEPGFHVLAVQRGGRYVYRPRGHVILEVGDELIASGPDEGHPMLAQRCGWHLTEDDDTGEHTLAPLRAANASSS